MTTRPGAPDPQHDSHVAFPDDELAHGPGPGLPPTAWAPDPGTRLPAPPPWHPGPLPGPHPGPRRRRTNAAWWVVGAFFALPMLGSVMWSNGVTRDEMMGGGMPMVQHQPAQPWDGALDPQILGVRTLDGGSVEGMLPDGPTYVVPPGTTTFRVEVAGVGPRGSLQVFGPSGDFPVDETGIPFAVEVDATDASALQRVVAQSAYPDQDIQCRIYAGDNLVAVTTGSGLAECALPSP